MALLCWLLGTASCIWGEGAAGQHTRDAFWPQKGTVWSTQLWRCSTCGSDPKDSAFGGIRSVLSPYFGSAFPEQLCAFIA